MPQLNIPSDIKQRKLLKACAKAGLEVQKKGGKGSHAKVFCQGKFVIVQHKLYKQMVIRILKEIELCGFDVNEITKYL